VGRGKKTKDEKQLFEWMEANKKSVSCRDMEWLVKRLGCVPKQKHSTHTVYSHPLLSSLPQDMIIMQRPKGEREPRNELTVPKPHPHDIMPEKNVKRILPKLRIIIQLQEETEGEDV